MKDEDPFELLGLERRFDIDRAALQAAYLKRSAQLHPDRFPDPIDQAEAAAKAACLNTARDVLADDERRADVLLRLLGGPTREEDKSLPDGFLMDIMEARQEMEDAVGSGDPAQRKRVEDWVHQQRSGFLDSVGRLFGKVATNADAQTLAGIRVQLNAWRYIERMIEQLDPAHELDL
ncbi:MAG: DnaJ domain-containing protein [Phycisphaerales bacterium]|nr:MAG: DnaJ domain-containing protein [Phycisphaerales bacterium]